MRRARALLASPAVASWRPPKPSPWPFHFVEPVDVATLYRACDGLTLRDGTVVLERAELARATSWLVEERSLTWSEDLFIVGERDDLVIVRDIDLSARRAGGGVLEAPTDGLETFERVATGIVGYLETRVGSCDPYPAPEAAARAALRRGDAAALAAALELPFYPGSDRALAHGWLALGALRAGTGDAEGALAAFERSVTARLGTVGRGAQAAERTAGWRACAVAAAEVGAQAVADACAGRALEP
jgi:hypothetical protein